MQTLAEPAPVFDHTPRYDLVEDTRPRLGLIVLQADESIEDDMRRLFPLDLARLHISRVPSGAQVTPETLAAMEADLPRAAALLPAADRFAVIAYGCTSGATHIGPERVARIIGARAQTMAVTDPLTAVLAAAAALGLSRVGIVSPYIDTVVEPVRAAFQARGIAVPDSISFAEAVEARVARIAPASIHDAALTLARRTALDAVFLSCTNLRTLDVIPGLEAELGLPVLSSNQALAWHMARLAGLRAACIPGHLAKLLDAPGRGL